MWIARLLVILACAVTGGVALAQDESGRKPGDWERRWRAMSDEERRDFRRNAEAWRQMDEAERAQLRQRFQRLERLREHLPERLGEEERRRLSSLDERQRRRVLDERVVENLRNRAERLPKGFRSRMRRELAEATPAERRRRAGEFVGREMGVRFERTLRRFLDSGDLSETEAERLRESFRRRRPADRFQALRELMLRRPEWFGLRGRMHERLRRAEDPAAALRALEELGRRSGQTPSNQPPARPAPERRQRRGDFY